MSKEELLRIYSAYLPYGLEVYAFHYILLKRHLKLIGVIDDEITNSNPHFKDDYDIPITCKSLEKDDFNYTGNYPMHDLKPILFSMDMLTQPIQHKGETFVPLSKLREIYGSELTIDEKDLVFTNHIEGVESFGYMIEIMDCYQIVQKLLEWHFNFFNLPDSAYIKKENLKK